MVRSKFACSSLVGDALWPPVMSSIAASSRIYVQITMDLADQKINQDPRDRRADWAVQRSIRGRLVS